MHSFRSENPAPYNVAPPPYSDDELVIRALQVLEGRMRQNPYSCDSPKSARDFLRLKLGALEHEAFGVVWLDSQNRVIDHGELFRGTLTQTSVYPREVVKAALACNAGAAILYHNHPSGLGDPSHADQALTKTIKAALALVEVTVLDHFIVAGAATPTSFAERGLL